MARPFKKPSQRHSKTQAQPALLPRQQVAPSQSLGRCATFEIILSGSTFALAAVIGDYAYLQSARALAPVQIIAVPADSVRRLFDSDSDFARLIALELELQDRVKVAALKDYRLRDSAERVANWILESDRQQGGHGRVTLCHDKQTLASRLGMTPEHLSRNLASLTERAIVRNDREIVITDYHTLRQRARPDPLIVTSPAEAPATKYRSWHSYS